MKETKVGYATNYSMPKHRLAAYVEFDDGRTVRVEFDQADIDEMTQEEARAYCIDLAMKIDP